MEFYKDFTFPLLFCVIFFGFTKHQANPSLMKTADEHVVAMTEVNHSVEKVPVAQRRVSIDFHKFNLEWIKK